LGWGINALSDLGASYMPDSTIPQQVEAWRRREQQAQLPPGPPTFGSLFDLRPTPARPLIHQDDPRLVDAALGKAAGIAMKSALPLVLGLVGGAQGMPLAATEALLAPFDNPDPRVMQGVLGWRPGMKLAEIDPAIKNFIPKAGKRLEVPDAQRYMQEMVRRHLGEIPDSAPDHIKMRRLMNLGRKEFADQLTQPYSGIDWYGPDTALGDQLLRTVYPELEDPVKDTVQKAMSSTMSNNSNPRAEAFNGARIWMPYRAEGRFPITQPSGRFWPAQGVTSQILKLNRMLNELGEKGVADFLKSHVSGRDIKYFVPNAKEIRLGELYRGSRVLGPKIGPYFNEVMGWPQPETVVDVWMMRQNRRRLGGLFDAHGNAIEAPRTEGERLLQMNVDRRLALEHGIEPRDSQSVGWHYEQELYRRLGLPTKSFKRSDGIQDFLRSPTK
jgi:hypothetical protein